MKKIIATILLLTIAVLSFASCGAINKDGEVSVIWSDFSDEYLFTISDALDRAMYIENIKYTHYDAKGSEAEQIKLANDAVKGGAVALVASVTNDATAATLIGIAKAANIPMVFLCSGVELSDVTMALYDKCVQINVDNASLATSLAERIAGDLISNYDAYDRNDDGKISYCSFGNMNAVSAINAKLKTEGKSELVLVKDKLDTTKVTAEINSIFGDYDGSGNEANETPVELILTDDDAYIEELLLALREYELNYQKLVTHFIPLYTVGIAANAAELEYGKPAEDISQDEKEKRDAYTVVNTIDAGFVSAAALENDDELALSCAKILSNFIKGKNATDGVTDAYKVSDKKILVPFTVYG